MGKPFNTCFSGNCEFIKQGESRMHCTHPDAIDLITLSEPCTHCGRKPNESHPGCGNCIGRGSYAYPVAYEDCDCSGYKRKKIKHI